MSPRIVIIGGGFAGVECARTLLRGLGRGQAEVVLFNKENHMVFQPLLAEVAGGSLNDESVISPLRQMMPGAWCRTEDVHGVDLAARQVLFHAHDGQDASLQYDHLVLACGNVVHLGGVPGMADHAFPLRTIADAMAIRSQVLDQLERADVCDSPEQRRRYLSFVVVGGGYSGVETAGEINDLVKDTLRYFRNIRPDEPSVTLVHSRDQILPEIGPNLREFARKRMEQRGIKMVLNARVKVATPQGVGLEGGGWVEGSTVVCTVGSAPSPLVLGLEGVKRDKGRLVTAPDMRLEGQTQAWALGDCALVINAHDGTPSPPTGQFALRQGSQLGKNILRVLRGQPTQPFRFKQLGQLCSIGGHCAVAEMFGMRLSGFFAWFVWRGVYLMKIPTWSRRIKVGFDWAWQLMFPRDLAHVRVDLSSRLGKAHYRAGDWVFREGDPANSFYAIDMGEVEVVREARDGRPEQVLAVLGAGAFFGEAALNEEARRGASVRARTEVELTVLGQKAFQQLSGSLAPLRDMIAESVRKRALPDLWERLPGAREVLQHLAVRDVLEKPPAPLLTPQHTLQQVLHTFGEHDLDIAYVSEDGARLDGVVTRTDIFRALDRGCGADTPLQKFMCSDPILATLTDSAATAAATLRERSFKWLPVVTDRASRHIEGQVKAQTLLGRVLQGVGSA